MSDQHPQQQQQSDSSLLDPPPITIILLRSPIPPSEGTDPYHDSFGPFCLPSFPLSALESGASTPLPAVALPLPPLELIDPHTLDQVAENDGAVDANAASASQPPPAPSTGTSGSSSTAQTPAAAPPPPSHMTRKRGKWITDEHILTTHHCSGAPDPSNPEVEIEREYCVTSVPIIAHRCVNVREIADRILWGCPTVLEADVKGDAEKLIEQAQNSDRGSRVPYDGVVVTSQRTVETLTQAVALALDTSKDESASPSTPWSRTPFFAVGPATSAALRSLGKGVHVDFAPKLVMGGSATGTGETLANYIVRHFNCSYDASTPSVLSGTAAARPQPPPRRLLVLQGDKALPLLPDMLRRAHPPLELDLVRAYETCADERFSDSCQRVSRTLALARQSRSRRPSWNIEGRDGATMGDGVVAHKTIRALTRLVESPGGMDSESEVSSSVMLEETDLVNQPSSASASQAGSGSVPVSSKSSRTSSFGSIASALSSASNSSHPPRPDWIVFFSPSGVQFAQAELQARGWFPPSAGATAAAPGSPASTGPEPAPPLFPRIAVLGPTTKRHLRDAHLLAPDAVAAIPGPPELREALKGAMKRIGREERKKEAEKKWREERLRRGGEGAVDASGGVQG